MPVAWRIPAASARAYGALPTPDRDLDRTIAHLLSTAQVNAGHLDVHTAGAQAAKDPALLAHHIRHATGHVRKVSSHLVKLHDALVRRVPAVGVQLDNLDQAIPGSRANSGPEENVPQGALDMSIAHDLASAQAASSHVDRHLTEAQAALAAGNRVSVTFNLEHAAHHIGEINHNLSELGIDLTRKLPPVGREIGMLAEAVTGDPPLPADRARPGRETDYDAAGSRSGPQPA